MSALFGPNPEEIILGGDDHIIGNIYDDALPGYGGNDTIEGGDGNDILGGFAGDDSLLGGSVSDSLDGGGGADTMTGGTGDDVYTVDNVRDVVIEDPGAGDDTIRSSVSFDLSVAGANVENLFLVGRGSISGTGDAGDNMIIGNTGSNRLDGGGGADTMIGDRGNDVYVVDDFGDVITEELNQGTDRVESAVSYVLGDHLENLTLLGTGDIDATGNDYNNTLVGNAGANLLDGGLGRDRLTGGLGDDVYVVDDRYDVVTERVGEGTDTVRSSISYTLASTLEHLTLTGSADIDANGNALDNELTGNAGANRLDGKAGADAMAGGDGDDTYIVDNLGDSVTENPGEGTDTVISSVTFTLADNVDNLTLTGRAIIDGTGNALDNVLVGNSRDNVLIGLAGDDTLVGGWGRDTFVIGEGVGRETIEDFQKGQDLIGLASGLGFDDLSFSGSDIIAGVETLASLTGFDATALDEFDFILL